MRPARRFVACVFVLASASCEASGPERFPDPPAVVASPGLLCRDEAPAASSASAPTPQAPEQEQGLAPGSDEAALTADGQASVGIDSSACPQDMNLVEGAFCPDLQQDCLHWMEDPARFSYARCAEFAKPSICKTPRVSLRFCIDRLEAAEETGMPVGNISFTDASQACQARGKRLCQEHEWVFACEGEEGRPYPYGYVRSPGLCNFERIEGLVTRKGDLADHRQVVTANPECLSPFGVQNMVGNIDEWVVLDRPHYSAKNGGRRMMSGLKGGWWGPLRNRCRPTTVDHDEVFRELQTGYRCCANTTGAQK